MGITGNINIIRNEDTCNNRAGQNEFSREFKKNIEFEEWLKLEKNMIK